MSDKPSYLGLLNAIAVGESRAHAYLTEWAAVTADPQVRQVLLTVAAREGEHGMSFARRINELGYEIREKDDPDAVRRLEIVRSDCSDREKMEALGLHRLDTADRPDIFDDMFKDHSIDIRTGELLGRYIAEERDSARLLSACHRCLVEADEQAPAPAADGRRLDALEAKLEAVCRTLEEMRTQLPAPAVTTTGG